jgi:hypothetical protein
MFETEVVEEIKTYFVFNIFFFPKIMSFVRLYGKIWYCRQATDGNIIRRMRIACWITKATDTHAEYVILIAFLLQQWFLELASMLP